MGEKHEKKFDPLTRPPSRSLAAGPSICHLSPVTRDGGGGGWGGTAMGITRTGHQQPHPGGQQGTDGGNPLCIPPSPYTFA